MLNQCRVEQVRIDHCFVCLRRYLQNKILSIAFYCAWYFRMWKNVPNGKVYGMSIENWSGVETGR